MVIFYSVVSTDFDAAEKPGNLGLMSKLGNMRNFQGEGTCSIVCISNVHV